MVVRKPTYLKRWPRTSRVYIYIMCIFFYITYKYGYQDTTPMWCFRRSWRMADTGGCMGHPFFMWGDDIICKFYAWKNHEIGECWYTCILYIFILWSQFLGFKKNQPLNVFFVQKYISITTFPNLSKQKKSVSFPFFSFPSWLPRLPGFPTALKPGWVGFPRFSHHRGVAWSTAKASWVGQLPGRNQLPWHFHIIGDTPQKSNMDTQKLPCLNGVLVFGSVYSSTQ